MGPKGVVNCQQTAGGRSNRPRARAPGEKGNSNTAVVIAFVHLFSVVFFLYISDLRIDLFFQIFLCLCYYCHTIIFLHKI